MSGTGVIGVKGGNIIVPVNNLMKSTKWLTFNQASGAYSFSGGSGHLAPSTYIAYIRFYADSSGQWWMEGSMNGSYSSTPIPAISTEVYGVVFKACAFIDNMNWDISAHFVESGQYNRTGFAWAEQGTNTIYCQAVAGADRVNLSFNVPLNAEPTIYTTAANMENVANIAAYIPNMCPTITRLLSGTAQTYTTPAGVRWLKIKMIGAGGGGGGSSNSNEGGTGGTGGTTSFGTSLLTAVGGSGGPGVVGIGGAGGTVTVNSPAISMVALAGVRAPGNPNNVSNQQVQSGAASPFAGGAIGGYGDAGGGAGLDNSGTGGGGGGVTTGYRGAGGGAGGYIEAIVKDPSATYTYSVGAGGTAGAAGPSGYVGGVGGSGVIIIEEHYI
jgi:hypothetical protein